MSQPTKTIIAVGSNKGLEKLAFFLARESIELREAPSAEAAIASGERDHADVIVLCWPLDGGRADELVDALGGSGPGRGGPGSGGLGSSEPGSRRRAIAILVEPDALPEVAGLERDGVVVLPTSWSALRLEESLAELLAASARCAVRMLVRLSVVIGDQPLHRACQTVNLSETGMALKTRERIDPGHRITFSFFLPEDDKRIDGEAEVVRRIDPEVEGFEGLGLRFVGFRTDGQARLEEFLAAHDAADEAAARSSADTDRRVRATGS